MPPPPPRIRVLYLIDHASSTGGAERFAVGLASHLPQVRFEPWLCATRWSGPVASQVLAEAGVRHVTLARQAKWDVHRLRGVVGLLRRHRFDILHTHMFGSNLWGSVLGTACRVPVIVAHEHSWSYEDDHLRAWVDGRVVGRLADRFIAVSAADGRRMVSVEGVPPEKVVVIPNGYIPSPRSTLTDIRAELAIPRDTLVIGIAAVLRPEKRVDLLLEAHGRVSRELPNAHLVIAGDGPCRAALERQARLLELDDRIHFLGARSDVDSVLQAVDVAALTSDREGSPLLVFECMANGTPLVATAVGGVPETVQDGHTGLLVPRRDPEALAAGLVTLLRDPARRAQMAAAGRDALSHYTIDAVANLFGALYDQLLVEARR